MSSTRPARRVLRSIEMPTTRGTVRRFGAVMIVGFGLLGTPAYLLGRPGLAVALWAIGAATGLLALAAPRAARPVYTGWMAVARVLGRINSAILLTLFYALLVCPVGLVFRLFGRDALRLRRREADSYWEEKSLPSDPRAYFNQF